MIMPWVQPRSGPSASARRPGGAQPLGDDHEQHAAEDEQRRSPAAPGCRTPAGSRRRSRAAGRCGVPWARPGSRQRTRNRTSSAETAKVTALSAKASRGFGDRQRRAEQVADDLGRLVGRGEQGQPEHVPVAGEHRRQAGRAGGVERRREERGQQDQDQHHRQRHAGDGDHRHDEHARDVARDHDRPVRIALGQRRPAANRRAATARSVRAKAPAEAAADPVTLVDQGRDRGPRGGSRRSRTACWRRRSPGTHGRRRRPGR